MFMKQSCSRVVRVYTRRSPQALRCGAAIKRQYRSATLALPSSAQSVSHLQNHRARPQCRGVASRSHVSQRSHALPPAHRFHTSARVCLEGWQDGLAPPIDSQLGQGKRIKTPKGNVVTSFRRGRQVLLERELPAGGALLLASNRPLHRDRPGYGGFQLAWSDPSGAGMDPDAQRHKARIDALDMALYSAQAHHVHATGFSGAVLVAEMSHVEDNPSARNKARQEVLEESVKLLSGMEGRMLIFSDLSSVGGDVRMMQTGYQCKHIVGSVDHPSDSSVATAVGLVASLEATLDGVYDKRVLVHGCGKVGATLAAMLRDKGARVLAIDKNITRADVPGCQNVSHLGEDWVTLKGLDAVAMTSKQKVLTKDVASRLLAPVVVGSVGLLFDTAEALEISVHRGIRTVPPAISSAGAILLGSIEYFKPDVFNRATPAELYEFVHDQIMERTKIFLSMANNMFRTEDSLAKHTGSLLSESADATSAPATVMMANLLQAIALEQDTMPLASQAFEEWWLGKQAEKDAKLHAEQKWQAAKDDYAPSIGADAPHPRAHRGDQPVDKHTLAHEEDSPNSDVIIVGGGVVGLVTAYQIKRRAPETSVTVLEASPRTGLGSSGASAAFLRPLYTSKELAQLAFDSSYVYREWSRFLEDNEAAAHFTQTGSLSLLPRNTTAKEARELAARWKHAGSECSILSPADVHRQFPLVNADMFKDSISGAEGPLLGELHALLEPSSGYMDATACMNDLVRACEKTGVNIRFNSQVKSIAKSPDGSKAVGVNMMDGRRLMAETAVVNASGPWFNALNDTTGVKFTSHVAPTRIHIAFYQNAPQRVLNLPFIADSWGESRTGIFIFPRKETQELVVGCLEVGRGREEFDMEVGKVKPNGEVISTAESITQGLDPDVHRDHLLALYHRIPSLPRRRRSTKNSRDDHVGVSSVTMVNTTDSKPLIGQTQLERYFVASGFGGHGFKLAPAVGSLLAREITGSAMEEWETELPLDLVSPHRTLR